VDAPTIIRIASRRRISLGFMESLKGYGLLQVGSPNLLIEQLKFGL
jgi:hypothetical protein